MRSIPARLRRQVIARAGGRCEYCRLPQEGQEALFHIDHIAPLAAGGPTTLANLALACVSCSLRKGARETAMDPASGDSARLFHPRRDSWDEHFRLDDVIISGLTATGRATVELLRMNRPIILAIRQEQQLLGRWP